ncbi:MAG: clostripain-related cysteine peptidase [Chloroflexota bacterium]
MMISLLRIFSAVPSIKFIYWVIVVSTLVAGGLAGPPSASASPVVQSFSDCNAVTEIPIAECNALVVLYNSTDGPNWSDSTNNNWLATDTPCGWNGINCQEGRVTSINLPQNNLTGTIPDELGDLTNLVALRLQTNGLTGEIPAGLGNLTNLGELQLYSNQLTGTIPSELGNLTDLKLLTLYQNELTGEIPDSFDNLKNLEQLNLFGNTLTGTIPASLTTGKPNLQILSIHDNQLNEPLPTIWALPSLVDLRLQNNQITGTIPVQLGNLTNLVKLQLYSNKLAGTIPSELGNLTDLETLTLYDNELTGEIPDSFGNLKNLEQLNLFGNTLTGTIPASLTTGKPNLQILSIHDNQLNEPLPTVWALPSLVDLRLQNNQITGTIPVQLGNLTNLVKLQLYSNKLTGTIPTELGSLTNLETLTLYDNELSGTLPDSLTASKPNLKFLNINSNNITGTLPLNLPNLSSLQTLDVGNNLISGVLPDELWDLNELTNVNIINTNICEPVTEEFQNWRSRDGRMFTSSRFPCFNPTIELSKSAEPAVAEKTGDTITYRVVVTATDNIAETIALTDVLPSGLSIVPGSITGGATLNDRQILYSGEVSPQEPLIITYQAKINETVVAGSVIDNEVIVVSDNQQYEDSASVALLEGTFTGDLVLIYASGDNDLAESMVRVINNAENGAPEEDSDNPNKIVRVLLDGPGIGDSYLYHLHKDDDPDCPNYFNPTCDGRYVMDKNFWTWGENAGSPHSLAEFIKGSINAYPSANKVLLSLVGHGGGWSPDPLDGLPSGWQGQPSLRTGEEREVLAGMLWDDHPGDALSTVDLADAIRWGVEATDRDKIDLLYLDACLMAMSEVAYELRDHVDYLLASQSWSWTSFGYDEHIEVLNDNLTTEEIGKAWLLNEATTVGKHEYPYTYSLVNLNDMETVLDAEDQLAEALIEVLPDDKEKIDAAFQATSCVDSDQDGFIEHGEAALSEDENQNTPWDDNYCDLAGFAHELMKEFRPNTSVGTAAQLVINAVKEAVIDNEYEGAIPWQYSNQEWQWDWLGGLNIYLPLSEDDAKRRFYTEQHLQSAANGKWDEFLTAYWEGLEPPEPEGCPPEGCPLPPGPLSTSAILATAQADQMGITIEWMAQEVITDVTEYRLVRREEGEATEMSIAIALDSKGTRLDPATSLEPNIRYCYHLEAVNSADEVIRRSDVACTSLQEVTLSMPERTVSAGDTSVVIPVTITNTSKIEDSDEFCTSAMTVTVRYDARSLRATTVAGSSPDNELNIEADVTIPGEVTVTASEEQCQLFSNGDTLFQISFDIVGGNDPVALDFVEGDGQTEIYSETGLTQPIPLKLISGRINIIDDRPEPKIYLPFIQAS